MSSSGQNVTAQAQGGQLGGLLQITNSVIPSLTGDSSQQGSLNELAQGIADTVNNLLSGGQTSSGAPGVPLFSYNASSPTAAASTLAISSGITRIPAGICRSRPPKRRKWHRQQALPASEQ